MLPAVEGPGWLCVCEVCEWGYRLESRPRFVWCGKVPTSCFPTLKLVFSNREESRELTVATGSDVLKLIRFPVLFFDNLPQILSTVMYLASFVDGTVVGTTAPASQATKGTADGARLPIST